MVTICPRQSTTARRVRVNAAEAVGSGRSARIRSTLGQVAAQAGRSERQARHPRPQLNAGSTSGSRSSASASLPIGNDASRSATLTSLVTPPAPTRTSRSTSCGNW